VTSVRWNLLGKKPEEDLEAGYSSEGILVPVLVDFCWTGAGYPTDPYSIRTLIFEIIHEAEGQLNVRTLMDQ
jgi:hypothetical protein